MTDSLRVLSLEALNVKRLRAVHIEPDPQGGLVIIGGANAAGKTSVLDCILYALGGERAIPPEPLREGETEATITLDLGEQDGKVKLRIVRRITKKGSYLHIEAGEDSAMRAKSPQKLLDGIMGALTFDPLAFTRMKAAEQRATLLEAMGLARELDDLESRQTKSYQERTVVGRELTSARAVILSLLPIPEKTPTEPIDINALSQRIEQSRTIQAQRQYKREQLTVAEEAWGVCRTRLAEAEQKRARCAEEYKAVPDAEDATPLKKQLAAAQSTNQAVMVRKQVETSQVKVDELDAAYTSLSDEIREIDAERSALLSKTPPPIPGIGFKEDCLTYDGLPFEQAASSIQLQTSAAVGMALNPTLRVMRIEDGSLLDGENLNSLAEMARSADFQIWIERVGGEDPGAIVIEDGTVQGGGA